MAMRRVATCLLRRGSPPCDAWAAAGAASRALCGAAPHKPAGTVGMSRSVHALPSAHGFAFTPLAVPSRRMATASSPGSEELANALGEEHSHEIESYEPTEAVARGPPSQFKVLEEPANAQLKLERSFAGGETVTVTVDVEDMQDDLPSDADPDEESDEANGDGDGLPLIEFRFDVSVTRSDKPGSLSFHCIAQRTDDRFEITAVSLEDDVTLPAEGLAYSGPIYQDLDERVLDAFHHYLLARGINAKFVEYLQELAIDKEQREYTQWLKRVREFVVKN